MRRITLWSLSTLTTLVLLFSYHTSTSSTPGSSVAAGAAAATWRRTGPPRPRTPAPRRAGRAARRTAPARRRSRSPRRRVLPARPRPTPGSSIDTNYGPVQVQITVVDGKVTRSKVTQVPWNDRRDQEINGYAVPILNKEVGAGPERHDRHGEWGDLHVRRLHPVPPVRDRQGPPLSASQTPWGEPAAYGTRAFVEQVMGMPVSIHVRAADTGRPDIGAAVANAYAHLRHVDAVLSPWRADSDLLRVRRGELEAASAHPWLAEVTVLAAEAEAATGGLFTSVLTGPDGTTGFDPTGLAKGWAVEGASAYLQVVDRISFCINAGGDLTIGLGRNLTDSTSTWRVGIQDPRDPMATVDILEVSDGAVATSGGSARGAHVIDPRSGRPVDRPGSVTVTGPDLVWADVWATAAWVDPDEAARLMDASHPAYRLRRHP